MRRTGLTIQLTALGNGEVNSVMASETLLQPDRAYVVAPLTPGSPNCRLLNGVVTPRFGYASLGATPASTAVTGLFQATFDDNVVENLRGDATGTRYLVGAATWTALASSTGTGTGGNWTYAMVRRAGGSSRANQVMFGASATTDSVWAYIGGGAAATTVGNTTGGGGSGFKGARAIVGHRGRSLVMNTFDNAAGARKIKRVNYSIVGDPTIHTGFGSGFVDLDDDPFPIANSKIIGGNVCVFNGSNLGGSLVVGTATGVANSPYRWDTVNTDNIGLLVPNSLVLVTTNLAFFLSHAGFALYDGARNLAPVAEGISRDVLSRLNYNKLDKGFSWFKPASSEIFVNLAMGDSVIPNETWVFNFSERRVYGPYTYTHPMTAASPYATTSVITWGTAIGTWAEAATNYPTWDSPLGRVSAHGILFGDSTGATWLDNEITLTDAGAPISTTYYCAPIRASGRTLVTSDGSQRVLTEDDQLTLRDITLTYRNRGVWLPAIAISTDGGVNWTNVTSGVPIGDDTLNIGRAMTAPFTVGGLSGTWFQARIFGSAPMELLGVRMEFTYGGNARND